MFLVNYSHNKMIKYLITFICLFLLCPVSGHTKTESAKDSQLFISPEYAAMQLKKKNHKYQIIDIRKNQEFIKVHIKGSINIPLHFIKSKRYLKKKTIIIADNGFFYRQIKEECKKLKNQNFDVRILNGGLNTWITKNLPIKGSVFSPEEFFLINPRKVYQEQSIHPVLFVDSSSKTPKSNNLKPVFSNIISLTTMPKQSFKELTKFNKINPTGSILVFNNFGEDYNAVRDQMLSKGITNLFFLKGGLNAYGKYLHNLKIAKAPKQERLKTIQKCRDCGDKDQ